MYQSFYGLSEMPFELTPDTRYLYLPPCHREALSVLEYGLSSAKAITVLIGEVGSGKTTLIQAAMASELCRDVTCIHLNNPALTRDEFVEILSSRFGLGARRASKAALLEELDSVLRERRVDGRITALVIDEAQSLSTELLEEIRLLANHETATEKLLPVVLAGQPEFKNRLNEPGLRQLKQRITLRCEIVPFAQEETAGYIAGRITCAGGPPGLFSREAVAAIHQYSGGLARRINVLCDNALMTGFALGCQLVTREIVIEVARDFDLHVVERRAPTRGLVRRTGGSADGQPVFPGEGSADTELPAFDAREDPALAPWGDSPARPRPARPGSDAFGAPARPHPSTFGR